MRGHTWIASSSRVDDDRARVEVGAPHLERGRAGAPPGASSSRPTASAHRVVVREHERGAGPQHAVHLAEQAVEVLDLVPTRRPRARGRSSRRAGTRGRRRRSRATRRGPRSASASLRPSASCAVEASSAITCAPWRASAIAFSPAPQPRSSTRLPVTSPHRRRSASVGRSGPYVHGVGADSPRRHCACRDPIPRLRCWSRPHSCRGSCRRECAATVAGGELLDHPVRFVVVVLHRRRLHEVRRRAEQRAADAAVERELGAAHRVDDHAGRVGRVPHLELQLDVERHVAEVAALEADVRPLPVVEPRHVIGRADVHARRTRCPGRSGS